MSLGVSPRAERWAVTAWLAIYLACAAARRLRHRQDGC